MAARTPRRSFASPFVVTLVAAPACYVQTSPGPQGPPPSQPPPVQTAEPQPQPQPPGPVITNPPRPTTQPAQPSQPPPQQKPPVVIANPPPPTQKPPPAQPMKPPPAQSQETRWTVYKAKDGSCMAAIKSECPPKATCNPPPPFKYACPDNVSLDKPITVATYDGTKCFVEFEMPACPPGVACNPPRPRPVACPKR